MLTGFIQNNKNEYFYYEIHNEDKKKTIIFLHGNGESSKLFHKILSDFIDYRVILFDTICHGESSKNRKILNFSDLADDLIFCIDKLDLSNIDLIVGYSDGGNTLLEIVRRNIVIANKLLLVSPNLNKRDISKKFIFFLLKVYNIFLYPLSFIKNIGNKRKIFNLMIKEPNYKLTDFVANDINFDIVVASDEFVKTKPLIDFLDIFKKKLITIDSTNHFNIIFNEKFIGLVKNMI